MHCNFSTDYLRDNGGKDYFLKLMDAFEANVEEHIAVYGPDNDQRLTGLHETQSIDKFSWGVGFSRNPDYPVCFSLILIFSIEKFYSKSYSSLSSSFSLHTF